MCCSSTWAQQEAGELRRAMQFESSTPRLRCVPRSVLGLSCGLCGPNSLPPFSQPITCPPPLLPSDTHHPPTAHPTHNSLAHSSSPTPFPPQHFERSLPQHASSVEFVLSFPSTPILSILPRFSTLPILSLIGCIPLVTTCPCHTPVSPHPASMLTLNTIHTPAILTPAPSTPPPSSKALPASSTPSAPPAASPLPPSLLLASTTSPLPPAMASAPLLQLLGMEGRAVGEMRVRPPAPSAGVGVAVLGGHRRRTTRSVRRGRSSTASSTRST